MGEQKGKLLRILEILKDTDENHPLTANQIGEKLAHMGIRAERKSICRDIAVLRDEGGYDIILCDDNKRGYFLGSREFEEWELKVLIDAIGSSRFLPKTSIKTITDKLYGLTSAANRHFIKSITPTETTHYHDDVRMKIFIDSIMRAIKENKKISIKYTYIDVDLKRKLRRDGQDYILNPYALVWDNSRYYLVCNYDKYEDLSYYHLDRMDHLTVLEEGRKPLRDILGHREEEKLRQFIRESIYRWSGESIRVTVAVPPYMVSELMDQFGADLVTVALSDEEREHTPASFSHKITFTATEGEGLYMWLRKYGNQCKVLGPKAVRARMIEVLQENLALYEEHEKE